MPALHKVYTTPEAGSSSSSSDKKEKEEDNLEVDDASLSERLGLNKLLQQDKETSKEEDAEGKKGPSSGLPKFQASLAWAQESSPAVLGSAELRSGPVSTYGVTLKAQGRREAGGTPVKVSEEVEALVSQVDKCVGRKELKEVRKERRTPLFAVTQLLRSRATYNRLQSNDFRATTSTVQWKCSLKSAFERRQFRALVVLHPSYI